MNDMDLIQSNQVVIMQALALLLDLTNRSETLRATLRNRAAATERQIDAKLTQWQTGNRLQGHQ